jgi:hypothetical protein
MITGTPPPVGAASQESASFTANLTGPATTIACTIPPFGPT